FNGRGVVVRINDRGPYVGDRILDLSQGAAQAIGLSGIGWVDATIVLKD
ncbi:MAG: septal ring lytic transglycosylase RlpA family lipoprotein, partial [Actinomycetota bacterium]|nr:septal ring lytic transglycosylase RlpA family lipoprotein [Actinomycetota bacterium]